MKARWRQSKAREKCISWRNCGARARTSAPHPRPAHAAAAAAKAHSTTAGRQLPAAGAHAGSFWHPHNRMEPGSGRGQSRAMKDAVKSEVAWGQGGLSGAGGTTRPSPPLYTSHHAGEVSWGQGAANNSAARQQVDTQGRRTATRRAVALHTLRESGAGSVGAGDKPGREKLCETGRQKKVCAASESAARGAKH